MLSWSIESSLAASDLTASSSSARSSAFTFHSCSTFSKLLPLFSLMVAAVLSHSIKISSSCTSGEPVDGLLVLRNLIVQRFDLLLRLESVSVYLLFGGLQFLNLLTSLNLKLGSASRFLSSS